MERKIRIKCVKDVIHDINFRKGVLEYRFVRGRVYDAVQMVGYTTAVNEQGNNNMLTNEFFNEHFEVVLEERARVTLPKYVKEMLEKKREELNIKVKNVETALESHRVFVEDFEVELEKYKERLKQVNEVLEGNE